MAYHARKAQLIKTLESFRQYETDKYDFCVVVVNDSDEELSLATYPFEVIIRKTENKTWSNPAPAFNFGFNIALERKPDIIIIQNPECYHNGDILGYAKKVTDETYLSFACYSQGEGEAIGSVIYNRGATFDGESAWYNHPVYRPVYYHFCSAITAKNLIKINGFDERFADGVGYDDNYLVHQIQCLGLHIELVTDPIVIHQWHARTQHKTDEATLFYRNRDIFDQLSKNCNYKALHALTPDLR
jgi:GT2 family glycosyltransferase